MTIHQPDFESGLLVKHRYFVALKPPREVLPAITRCARQAAVAKPSAADRLHMTLFVTEDFETEPDGLADRMRIALDRVRDEAFDLSLLRYGHLGGSLVTGPCRPLRRLQAQIARSLVAGGVAPRADWAFNPHVTLGYEGAKLSVSNRPIQPIAWCAREFELVHSLLRLTIHRTLGRWPLIEQPRLL